MVDTGIHHLSSNVVSGPGTWGMTTGNMILMTITPPDLPVNLPNIDLELPAGHNIDLMLPAGSNIDLEIVT